MVKKTLPCQEIQEVDEDSISEMPQIQTITKFFNNKKHWLLIYTCYCVSLSYTLFMEGALFSHSSNSSMNIYQPIIIHVRRRRHFLYNMERNWFINYSYPGLFAIDLHKRINGNMDDQSINLGDFEKVEED